MDEEKYKYISEKFADIGVKTLEDVLKLSDETGEDRDKLVRTFAHVMLDMAHANTFSDYKL